MSAETRKKPRALLTLGPSEKNHVSQLCGFRDGLWPMLVFTPQRPNAPQGRSQSGVTNGRGPHGSGSGQPSLRPDDLAEQSYSHISPDTDKEGAKAPAYLVNTMNERSQDRSAPRRTEAGNEISGASQPSGSPSTQWPHRPERFREILTPVEAAQYLRLDETEGHTPESAVRTLNYWRDRGELRATKFARRVWYRRAELDRFLEVKTEG